MAVMSESSWKLAARVHEKMTLRSAQAEAFPTPRGCPMLQSLDGQIKQRRRPFYMMAAFLHGVILVPVCLQIHRSAPMLAEDVLSMHAISMICPAVDRQPRAPQTARVATPSSQTTAEQPVPQAAVSSPTRIARSTTMEAPSDEVLANIAWTGETLAPPLSATRFAAHGATVSLASADVADRSTSPEREAKGSAPSGSHRWEVLLMNRIAQFRRYPESARRQHEQGVVYLWFRMDRTGRVLAARVDKSSGSSALDQEALATLNRAQPLPSAPPDRPAVFELELPIEFHLVR
jgi:protein TonB